MISLRSYNLAIEQLIDSGQYDESIAHCQFILEKFPKCIETYRNLGKTLLELKKYPEAMDMFSRVLSVFPDDFISHVGLSIIYEDQKDLSRAIWHMELAFDVQPSNLAIQDELKRLFALRDGEQPIKIRLTRGALVRMYARGELFQQAISEFNSILDEDPKRIDLEVILARMNFLSGSIEDAMTVCKRIIDKIPYCFEANQILQEIYLSKNEIEDASVCQNRLITLDPYYRFLDSPFSNQEISDNKVQLEKLVFVPSSKQDSQSSVWINTFDDQWNDSLSGNINLLQETSQQIHHLHLSDFESEDDVDNENAKSAEPSVEDVGKIPEWMKTAGWTTSSVVSDEKPLNDNNESGSLSENIINDNGFPEWLIKVPSNNKNNESNSTFFTNPSSEVVPNLKSNVTNDDLSLLFSEIKEEKMDDKIINNSAGKDDNSQPSDWLSQFSEIESNESQISQSDEIPDWLKKFENDEIENNQATDFSDEMPDWLRNLQDEVEPVSQNSSDFHPEVTQAEPIIESVNQSINENFSENNIESVLENIGQDVPLSNGWGKPEFLVNEENTQPVSVVENSDSTEIVDSSSEDTIPAWVKSVLVSKNENDNLNTENVPQTSPLQKEKATQNIEIPSENELNDNLSSSESDEGIISQQTNDELLDWLRDLKNEDETNPVETEDSTLSEIPELESYYSPDENPMGRLVESLSEIGKETSESPEQNISEQYADNLEGEKELDEISAFKDVFSSSDNEIDSELESTSQISGLENSISAKTEILAETVLDDIDEVAGADFGLAKTQELLDLITKNKYDQLFNVFNQSVAEGMDFNQLILSIESVTENHLNDFAYWQSLGDIYSHHNKLKDALSAYQISEEILIKAL